MSHKSTPASAEIIALGQAELHYYPHFLTADAGLALFTALRDSLCWEQSRIKVYGREHPIPRLNAWYGDEGISYRYSGRQFDAHPWLPALQQARQRIAAVCPQAFNSVLANYYRDGNDCMGWHADNEPELGRAPVIAALSLGSSRCLRFRANRDHRQTLNLDLAAGSLLIMGTGVQQQWQHSLPRRARAGQRISLTFRQVANR